MYDEMPSVFLVIIKLIIHSQEPERIGEILEAIQSISDEARRILADPELSREKQLHGIGVCPFFI